MRETVDGSRDGRADGSKRRRYDGKQRLCRWCNKGFKPKAPNQHYCTKRHKQMAYKARREATLSQFQRLLIWRGVDAETAWHETDKLGVERIRVALTKLHFVYDERDRQWHYEREGE